MVRSSLDSIGFKVDVEIILLEFDDVSPLMAAIKGHGPSNGGVPEDVIFDGEGKLM